MNELQVFQNKQFGNLEILSIEGKEWFPAIQVAEILGYANPRDAISRHGSSKITRTPKVTGKGQQYFINKFLSKEA